MTERVPGARVKRSAKGASAVDPQAAAAARAVDPATAPSKPIAPKKTRRPMAPANGSGIAARSAPIVESLPVTPTASNAAVTQRATKRRSLTVESGLYLLMIVAAILTRFWALGAKALHHDESLHAYYSWVYETGGGYRHDPLMHGPFLFHANALIYLLFGDSNATSRYMPALFGVVLVALPYLLRSPHLFGRWGALTTSFFFLVSPVLLYQSRYIRHDIYTVVGTMVLFIAIVRYWERPQQRWIVVGLGALSFLFTNHEIMFAIAAVFAAYLYWAFILALIRDWRHDRRDLALQLVGLHVGAFVLAGLVDTLMPTRYKDRIYNIPWQNPTKQQQIDYYKDLISNPLVLLLLAIGVGFIAGLVVILRAGKDPERTGGFLSELLGEPQPRTIEAWVKNLFTDKKGLTIGLLVAIFIFVTLFTSLYTNLYGLVSSTFATDGTLLYWLGQHNYRRGEQPWFYFLLLMPQYEFVAVILGVAMAAVTTFRGIGSVFGWCKPGRNLFVRLFIVVWFAGILAGLSYAGEKMPWLLSHITLPATLLAAIMVGAVAERIEQARHGALESGRRPLALGWPEWSLGIGILAATACWFILAGRWTVGRYVDYTGGQTDRGGWIRALTSDAVNHWWFLALPPLAILLAIAVFSFVRGTTRTGLVTALSLTAILVLLQVNAGWRLSYTEPDVPTEMMIYTQTSPDVARVMDEITQLSFELTGGYGIEVWYDSGVSWPFQWYLRDFPNKRFVGSSITDAPQNAAVLLLDNGCDKTNGDVAGYTAQDYVLRWWFPEETYRDFAIAPEIPVGRSAWNSPDEPHGPAAIAKSVVDSVDGALSPDGLASLYRLLVYRDLDRKLGHCDFKFYVRNDLLPMLNAIRY